MVNEISGELIKEAVEFAKFLRRVVLIVVIVTFSMMIPVKLSYSEPPAFYILKKILDSLILGLLLRLDFNSNNSIILIAGSPAGHIRVLLSSALFFGLLVSSPILLYFFYRYLRPALYPHERRAAVRVVFSQHCYSIAV